MSVSLYLGYDYKKELCINLTKKIVKTCYSIKENDREKCLDLLDKYKKFCSYK